MLKIGNLVLKAPFVQAPLSGYSDYAMRRLALDFGAPLTFAGVMLAKSAAHPKILKKPEFQPHDDEHPIGAQIFGDDPSIMSKAAKDLQAAGYDIIDLNFSCPTPKVVSRKRGGWMMTDPENVIQVYKSVRDAVTCPVTIKLRVGFDSSSESYDKFYDIVSETSRLNIDALTIHGRTVAQRFSGPGNWDIIAKIKNEFPKTTIIGSGDLFEPQEIINRLKTANLDGVQIARGAIGNPWIYRGLNAILEGKPVPNAPTLDEQAEIIRKHFEIICRLYDKKKSVWYFRKFSVRYCRLHPLRKHVQRSLLAASSGKELLDAIDHWYSNNNSEIGNS
ncbi:MAG: tRNA-dihydrouridine synthase [Sedimentisphaerales bacterium]|nr:tRNA-dihydrouridine synthase [Sedimentisphaerales bacterium]